MKKPGKWLFTIILCFFFFPTNDDSLFKDDNQIVKLRYEFDDKTYSKTIVAPFY